MPFGPTREKRNGGTAVAATAAPAPASGAAPVPPPTPSPADGHRVADLLPQRVGELLADALRTHARKAERRDRGGRNRRPGTSLGDRAVAAANRFAQEALPDHKVGLGTVRFHWGSSLS